MSSHIEYLDMPLQEALNNIIMYLKSSYAVSGRTLALLLLQEDPYVEDLVQKAEGQNYEKTIVGLFDFSCRADRLGFQHEAGGGCARRPADRRRHF